MKNIILVFIAFLFLTPAVKAQWSGDPSVADTRVIVHSAQQNKPHIVSDGSGGAIVFWIDDRSSGDNIYYNRLSSEGVTVWASATEGVNLTNNSDYNDINQVISDDEGGAFILWDNGGQIWVQHINNMGAKVWPFNLLIGDGEDGFLCSDGNGGIIFTWSSYIGNDEYQTYAQLISSEGFTQWYAPGYDGIPVIASAGSRRPMGVTTDGNGGAIIVMVDGRNNTFDEETGLNNNLDIFAQKIDQYGSTIWGLGGMPVCLALGNQPRYGDQPSYTDYECYSQGQQHPCVISDGAGGAIIAWEDYRDDLNNGNTEYNNNGDIYAQRINGSGIAQWYSDGNEICSAFGDQYSASLMPDGNGGAVVAWIDKRYGGANVYAQKITSYGDTQWSPDGISASNEIYDPYYTMVPDASNTSMLISWATLDNFGYEIRTQKIKVDGGSLAWGTEGVLVCSVGDGQTEPVIAPVGTSGAIVAWTDERNSGTTNLDIYAGLVIDGVLPISLISFDAQLKNEDVLIRWSTSSEQTTSNFELERSMDGHTFSKIGTVRASGTSTSAQNYTFTDLNPENGINFYRLKIVDADAQFSYSRIAKVTVLSSSTLSVFSNPAKDVLYLQRSGGNENGLIQIFDLSGKMVKEQSIVFNGNSKVAVDISHLAKGEFSLTFINDGKAEQLKFVRQ